jgi:hypothetical protein
MMATNRDFDCDNTLQWQLVYLAAEATIHMSRWQSQKKIGQARHAITGVERFGEELRLLVPNTFQRRDVGKERVKQSGAHGEGFGICLCGRQRDLIRRFAPPSPEEKELN